VPRKGRNALLHQSSSGMRKLDAGKLGTGGKRPNVKFEDKKGGGKKKKKQPNQSLWRRKLLPPMGRPLNPCALGKR